MARTQGPVYNSSVAQGLASYGISGLPQDILSFLVSRQCVGAPVCPLRPLFQFLSARPPLLNPWDVVNATLHASIPRRDACRTVSRSRRAQLLKSETPIL